MRVTKRRICPGPASGKLVHVGLAKDNNTSIQKLPHHRRVTIGRSILESLRSNGCPRAAHLEKVFDHNWHPMQPPAVPASAQLRIPLSCRLERLLLENRNKGVELRLKLLDTGEVRLGEIERGQIAAAELCSGFRDRGRQVGCPRDSWCRLEHGTHPARSNPCKHCAPRRREHIR